CRRRRSAFGRRCACGSGSPRARCSSIPRPWTSSSPRSTRAAGSTGSFPPPRARGARSPPPRAPTACRSRSCPRSGASSARRRSCARSRSAACRSTRSCASARRPGTASTTPAAPSTSPPTACGRWKRSSSGPPRSNGCSATRGASASICRFRAATPRATPTSPGTGAGTHRSGGKPDLLAESPAANDKLASMTKLDYDAAVIGGGPGGSSAATALVRRGRRVLLLERDKFPRFHIGESQLPWNNEVLRELGAFEAITGGGFMPKWGASFRRPDGVTEQYADFAHAVETPTPLSYQVDRERFDDILLRHAARSGVDVRERHRFLDAAFDADGVTVRYADADGAERSSRVAAVVDASGRAGVIVNRFGRHEYDPMLQNVAIHAQVVGVPRAEGRRAGDIRMFTRPDMGWLWLIPLTDTVMSIGAVIPKATHRREAKESAEASLDHYFAATPQAAALLERAKRTSPARVDVDYSYLATRMAGERWIAVGDSAAFLDPLFSTGVLLAMQGGIEAAEAI